MSDTNQNPGILIPSINDCHARVRQALQDIIRRLGTSATPTYGSLTLTNLTATKLVKADADKTLAPADIYDFVDGTTNQINKANDGDGTMTLSTPQDTHAGANMTLAGMTLTDTPLDVPSGGTGLNAITDHSLMLGSGTGAVTPLGVAANGQLPIGSVGADPVLATLTGTAPIEVTNGAGSVTLDVNVNGINDTHIDFGLGANQVNAADPHSLGVRFADGQPVANPYGQHRIVRLFRWWGVVGWGLWHVGYISRAGVHTGFCQR